MITIQRTSKPLKLLQAVGSVALYGGAGAYVLGDYDVGLALAAIGLVTVAISRLLIWWFHR